MLGPTNCDVKKLYTQLDEEMYDDVLDRVDMGIQDMIEAPVIGIQEGIKEQLNQILKPAERRLLKRELKREEDRYKEHQILYKFLEKSSEDMFRDVEIFVVPEDFVETRIFQIRELFAQAFNQLPYANKKDLINSGLNNRRDWDAGKIRAIRKRIVTSHNKYFKRGKGRDKLTNYENTIKGSMKMAADLDQTGAAVKLLSMSKGMLDSYLQAQYKWIEGYLPGGEYSELNLTAIDNQITGAAQKGNIPGQNLQPIQKTKVAVRLFEELVHTETRNIIPQNIPKTLKEFNQWRNSWLGKKFFEMQKFQSERHQMGVSGAEHVLIPLHVDKEGVKILRNIRKQDIADGKIAENEDPGKFENAYIAYRIPEDFNSFLSDIRTKKKISEQSLEKHLLDNEVEEGFYTADDDAVFDYEFIEGTNTPKKKYTSFNRGVDYMGEFVYQPPSEWMRGIWDALEDQRKFAELFWKDIVINETALLANEMRAWHPKILSQLANAGYEPEIIKEMIDMIENMGMENNFWPDPQGNYVSANTLARKASRMSYGPISYYPADKRSMMKEAIDGIEKKIESTEASLSLYQNILDGENVPEDEIYEAEQSIDIGEGKLAELNEALDAINNLLFGDPDTEEGRAQIKTSQRILHTKHRSLFTDKKRRIKDRSVWRKYVTDIFRTSESTRLRIQAYKTLFALRNSPSLLKYLINEVRNSVGEPFTDAGFMGWDYSDERIAELWPGEATPEDVRAVGLFVRGWKTGANLGTWTSFTNNFQRITPFLNYGIKPMMEAIRALRDGDPRSGASAEELLSQVRETGVLEPANAMVDALVMGIGGIETDYLEGVLPIRDILALWKNTTLNGWLATSNGWNKILGRASERSEGERVQVEELIRIKTLLWEFMHHDKGNKKQLKRMLRDAKIGLNQSYINRLVYWKISWMPAGAKMFTLKGGEEQMRSEVAVAGFFKTDDLGRIPKPPNKKKWRYTDSQDAIDMARLYVYANLFGMNSPHLPKMFRGAFGATNWQWRPYDWFQTQEDHRKFRNAVLASPSESPILGGMSLVPRLMLHIMKKGIRAPGLISETYDKKFVKWIDSIVPLEKKWDDKMLDDLVNFLLIRGTASVLATTMFYSSPAYGAWRTLNRTARMAGLRNPMSQRAIFGLESPLISRSLHAIMLALLTAKVITADDDEVYEDVVRDYAPVFWFTMFLWIMDFEKNFGRGLKTWLPTPFRETVPRVVDGYFDN